MNPKEYKKIDRIWKNTTKYERIQPHGSEEIEKNPKKY